MRVKWHDLQLDSCNNKLKVKWQTAKRVVSAKARASARPMGTHSWFGSQWLTLSSPAYGGLLMKTQNPQSLMSVLLKTHCTLLLFCGDRCFKTLFQSTSSSRMQRWKTPSLKSTCGRP